MNETQSRSERKKERTKQSLVDAAKELFVKHGYGETTIDQIVELADVAKVTFYYHFKSKEEIALEIKRQGTEEAVAYFDTLLSRKLSLDEMIDSVIVDLADWTETNWRLLEVFCAQRFSPFLERESTTECKLEAVAVCLLGIIEYGQKEGRFRTDIDGRRIAHLLALAILCEQYHWARSGQPKEELIASLKKCFDFALHGIVQSHDVHVQ
jgi:AcrR family transcriptional regulator